jgi:hypothetical protein
MDLTSVKEHVRKKRVLTRILQAAVYGGERCPGCEQERQLAVNYERSGPMPPTARARSWHGQVCQVAAAHREKPFTAERRAPARRTLLTSTARPSSRRRYSQAERASTLCEREGGVITKGAPRHEMAGQARARSPRSLGAHAMTRSGAASGAGKAARGCWRRISHQKERARRPHLGVSALTTAKIRSPLCRGDGEGDAAPCAGPRNSMAERVSARSGAMIQPRSEAAVERGGGRAWVLREQGREARRCSAGCAQAAE